MTDVATVVALAVGGVMAAQLVASGVVSCIAGILFYRFGFFEGTNE